MRPRLKKALRRAAYAAAFAFEAAAAAWIAGPLFVDDPLETLRERPSLVALRDRDDEFLGWLRPESLECRIPVPLHSVSSNAVAAILAVEDGDFYSHGAVDWLAAARALSQNLRFGKVVSGASTISMQTASLARKHGRHTLKGKLLQIFRARRMEYLHSKDEILQAYLDNLPFGGKITGIEAAAIYYFGTHANDLTLAEATYLAGIPQKPNAYRPDRHPEAAARRYATARALVERAGLAENTRDLPAEPPPMRDFAAETDSPFTRMRGVRERAYPMSFLVDALREHPTEQAGNVRSTLSMRLCEEIEEMLRRRAATMRNVRDAAAVAIDNTSGEVVAYVGTLDFASPKAGQVDAARSVRSAGSTLKPFFFAEAVAGGMLVEDTMMSDEPLRYADYSPLNFSLDWSGAVSARDALARSLNAPAVALVATLGLERAERTLAKYGLFAAAKHETGLSAVFGTGGYTLLDIARAYSALATGRLRDLRWTIDGTGGAGRDAARRAAPENAAALAMLARMLRSRPLPGAPAGVAWKTGTSNNLRDAWCFAYTPRWTVGVWFGNKDGSRSEDLVGGTCAAPAAGEIMMRLRGPMPVADWDESGLEDRELCAESGLSPSVRCTNRRTGKALRGIPLAQCRMAHAEAAAGGAKGRPLIISPKPAEYAIDMGEDAVRLELKSSEPDTLFLADGVPAKGMMSFGEGLHSVEAVSRGRSEKLFFSVIKP